MGKNIHTSEHSDSHVELARVRGEAGLRSRALARRAPGGHSIVRYPLVGPVGQTNLCGTTLVVASATLLGTVLPNAGLVLPVCCEQLHTILCKPTRLLCSY